MAGYEGLEAALRLQAKEARLLRNRAKPGEHIELEARFTDQQGSSGVNRQFWYNARDEILRLTNGRIAFFRRAGYIVEGSRQPYKLEPLLEGLMVLAGPSSNQTLDTPALYREIKPEYPYPFTGPHTGDISVEDTSVIEMSNLALNWSGAILKTYSQYVSHSINSPEGGGTFRLQMDTEGRRDPGAVQWQLKSTNPNNVYDSPQHWLRISVSSEAPTQPPTVLTAKVYTRYISRHSFYLQNARVDFSKVYSASGDGDLVKHEIEVEYIPNTGLPLSSFMEVIKTVTRAMFQTPLLFSKSDLYVVSKIVNAKMREGFDRALREVPHINRELLSEAQALRSYMLNSAFMFGSADNERIYNVSLKIDGYRMIYVIDPKLGTWLAYPPYQVNFCSNTPEHRDCNITVFEGEVSRDESTGLDNFWYIDAMIVDGENLRERYPWTIRKQKFVTWQSRAPLAVFSGAPKIIMKDVISLRRVMPGTNVFSVMEELYAGRSRMKPQSAVDGLVFTPELSSYNDACTSIATERIIFKWKEVVTIDLLVRIEKSGGIDLFMRGSDERDIPFRGIVKAPFVGRIIMSDIPIINDSVVEFRYSEGDLIAYRLRLEKAGPNSASAVESSWTVAADASNIVTAADLFGHNATLMRKSHNRIKKSLIAVGAGSVLDIGLGRFGDASKYEAGNYSLILGIDPYGDESDMEEAHKRLGRMSPEFQSKVHIRKMGGHETDRVVAFVMAMTNGEGVDTIAAFDSLTFLFDPERKMLDALVQTIKRCLKPNGVMIWRAMYGEKVIEHMNERGVTELTFGSDDLLRYNTEADTLHVKIAPRISQDEYIVRMEEFKERTGLVGEAFNASNESMLSRDYLIFSQFFYHGVLTYPDALKYPAAIKEVFGAREDITARPGTTRAARSRVKVPTFTSSPVLIEAIEKLFTSESHAKLMDRYWAVALKADPLYFAPGDSEPPPSLFETAGMCYFSDIYLANVVEHGPHGDIPRESEIFNAIPARENEVYHSLALAYILGIDVFVISREKEFIITNAVQGSTNPCLIATLFEETYSIERAGALYPFHRHQDLNYDAHLLKKVHLPEFYANCGMNNAVLSKMSLTETNILERVSHADTVREDVCLNCLANTLLQKKKKFCDPTDIEKIGLPPDNDVALDVTDMMERMIGE